MKPETILIADPLDIVFENRNRDYGAYELRKHYAWRLKKSITIIFMGISTFSGIYYWTSSHQPKQKIIVWHGLDSVRLVDVDMRKETHLIPLPAARKKIIEPPLTNPLIVKEPIAVKPIPLDKELDHVEIGTGTNSNGPDNPGPANSSGGEAVNNSTTDNSHAPEQKTIYERAEFMPEYPGGMEALRRFLSRNLHMPKGDTDPGTTVRVLARFVIDEEGNVTGLELLQHGGTDFDEEVLRVIRKMPRWKPGMQNGLKVSVYYNLPVIFQAQEDN